MLPYSRDKKYTKFFRDIRELRYPFFIKFYNQSQSVEYYYAYFQIDYNNSELQIVCLEWIRMFMPICLLLHHGCSVDYLVPSILPVY